MTIGIFRVLGIIGPLAEELGAAAEDGRITISEGIRILRRICDALGLDLDEEGLDL